MKAKRTWNDECLGKCNGMAAFQFKLNVNGDKGFIECGCYDIIIDQPEYSLEHPVEYADVPAKGTSVILKNGDDDYNSQIGCIPGEWVEKIITWKDHVPVSVFEKEDNHYVLVHENPYDFALDKISESKEKLDKEATRYNKKYSDTKIVMSIQELKHALESKEKTLMTFSHVHKIRIDELLEQCKA